MKTFDIYEHPALGLKAVKDGYSFPALFFSVIWLLVNKLWGYAVLFWISYFLLSIISNLFEQEGSAGGLMLISLIFISMPFTLMVFGNDLVRKNLILRGFIHIAQVNASTGDAAIALAVKGDKNIYQVTKDIKLQSKEGSKNLGGIDYESNGDKRCHECGALLVKRDNECWKCEASLDWEATIP